MYVDDVLSGVDTIAIARAKAAQLDKLLTAGGFHLQKWISNEEEVLTDIALSRRALQSSHDFDDHTITRTLGIFWDSSKDRFVFKIPQRKTRTLLKKRLILSQWCTIFSAGLLQ